MAPSLKSGTPQDLGPSSPCPTLPSSADADSSGLGARGHPSLTPNHRGLWWLLSPWVRDSTLFILKSPQSLFSKSRLAFPIKDALGYKYFKGAFFRNLLWTQGLAASEQDAQNLPAAPVISCTGIPCGMCVHLPVCTRVPGYMCTHMCVHNKMRTFQNFSGFLWASPFSSLC